MANDHMLAGYAIVLLRQGDTILFLKRSQNESFAPGHYHLVGGRLEKNETFRQALVRELHEEVGVTVNQDDLKFVHIFYKDGSLSEFVACVFECTTWQGDVFNKEPQKHSDLVWAPLSALPQPILPTHQRVLEAIKEKRFYSEETTTHFN